MPRFFFHIYNGHGDTLDDVGTDLASQAAAHGLAVDSIRSMIAEDARSGLIDLQGRIEVHDEVANLLVAVTFIEAFELHIPEEGTRQP